MRQRHSIFIPILALSFLVGCKGDAPTPPGPEPDPPITYTVTFDSRGGSYTPDSQTIKAGDKAVKPDDPTKDGFSFGGWYTDEATIKHKYDFSSPVVSDLTLYAKWEVGNLVTVTFDAGEGTFANGEHTFSISVDKNSELNLCLNIIHEYGEPTLADNTFAYYDYKDTNKGIGYNDIVTKDVTILANYFPTTDLPYTNLNEIDWEVIKKVATNVSSDVIKSVFAIGATKDITLSNGVKHTIQILDFHRDSLHYDQSPTMLSAKYAGITFDFRTVISNSNKNAVTTKWDESSSYKFTESTFNTLLSKDIFDRLPDDLKPLIENVDKHVGEYDSSFTAKKYQAKLFPLAHNEMASNAEGVTSGEGSIYEYYDEGGSNARIKKDSNNNVVNYWLRSPYAKEYYGNFNHVWKISTSGNPDYSTDCMYNDEHAFAPGFCI